MKSQDLRPRQVQTFMPTPGTIATAMYVSRDRSLHQGIALYRQGLERALPTARTSLLLEKEEWPHVREALLHWGRSDLIGKKKTPPCAAWTSLWRLEEKRRTRDFWWNGHET